MEERRDKLGGNQIETLKKRITNNQTKINQHKGVPGLEAEVAKLEESSRNVSFLFIFIFNHLTNKRK